MSLTPYLYGAAESLRCCSGWRTVKTLDVDGMKAAGCESGAGVCLSWRREVAVERSNSGVDKVVPSSHAPRGLSVRFWRWKRVSEQGDKLDVFLVVFG